MVLDLLKRSTIRNGLIDTLLNNQDLIISIVNNRGGELSSDNMNLIKKHSYYTTQCEQTLINKNKYLRNWIVELLTH
ncbi:MAG TPA: hypothetical protein PLW93_01100 [Candidatus Absconditabacterales bacterium]|nr:hypothetical protein [Candidatus Absconditabacterales bacterium]HNG96849.1 hypothetical protein [Candidatus Absconditabacterales bacterium]